MKFACEQTYKLVLVLVVPLNLLVLLLLLTFSCQICWQR